MVYVIIIALFVGVILIDYLPKRKLLSRPIRWFYVGICFISFTVLMLEQANMPIPRVSTLLTWMVEKIYGI
ncbi:hypothetical protein [Clostridium merdae]|uniref:hypothetical protein n=1 Tax=Clostridium merdae TaxID=1958780 RepID=UPI000A26B3B2|nr:hypothetical protein [Clostridium merdae]